VKSREAKHVDGPDLGRLVGVGTGSVE